MSFKIMRDLVFIFCLAIITICCLAQLAMGEELIRTGPRASIYTFKNVSYVDNYDGDTIRVNIASVHPLLGNRIRIRLSDVDTPEIRSKDRCEKDAAREAKNYVQALLIKARTINLKNVRRGKFFRLIANVEIDNLDLGTLLLRKGLAVPYGEKGTNWCTYR